MPRHRFLFENPWHCFFFERPWHCFFFKVLGLALLFLKLRFWRFLFLELNGFCFFVKESRCRFFSSGSALALVLLEQLDLGTLVLLERLGRGIGPS